MSKEKLSEEKSIFRTWYTGAQWLTSLDGVVKIGYEYKSNELILGKFKEENGKFIQSISAPVGPLSYDEALAMINREIAHYFGPNKDYAFIKINDTVIQDGKIQDDKWISQIKRVENPLVYRDGTKIKPTFGSYPSLQTIAIYGEQINTLGGFNLGDNTKEIGAGNANFVVWDVLKKDLSKFDYNTGIFGKDLVIVGKDSKIKVEQLEDATKDFDFEFRNTQDEKGILYYILRNDEGNLILNSDQYELREVLINYDMKLSYPKSKLDEIIVKLNEKNKLIKK